MIRLTLAMLVMLPFLSCKKEDPKPTAPVIAFTSISADSVVQFTNSIQIKFTYEDFQGDLGRQDPDDYSLRVQDTRLGSPDWYHIPPMTPEEQELHIKGTYTLQLDPLFILGNGNSESSFFSIQLQDRAGNWSNVIETPIVIITDSL